MRADGEAALQDVFHAHLHIIPRFVGGGFTIDASWTGRSRDSLAASANAIRRALQASAVTLGRMGTLCAAPMTALFYAIRDRRA